MKLYQHKFINLEKEDFKNLESLNLNKSLMRLPSENEDIFFRTKYNIMECYRDILILKNPVFKKKLSHYKIIKSDMKFNNSQDWMREVIWYGHRSGKYLCKVEDIELSQVDQKSYEMLGPYIS